MSITEKFIADALELAKSMEHEYLTTTHLLYVMVRDPAIKTIVNQIGGNVKGLIDDSMDLLNSLPTAGECGYSGPVKRAIGITRVVERAAATSLLTNDNEVSPVALLFAMASETDSDVGKILSDNDLGPEEISSAVEYIGKQREKATETVGGSSGKDRKKGGKQPTMLEQFARNLNDDVNKGKIDDVIGREVEIQDTIEVISRRRKNNVLYVGPAGVGKTSLAEGLAVKIAKGEVPDAIKDKIVFNIDMSAMLAGTKYRGDFEERLQGTLNELCAMGGKAIAFIDEFHTVMGAGSGSGGSMDASNIMKPYLARGEFTCIGATTEDEYHTHLASDKAFMRRFQKYDIKGTDVNKTKLILAKSIDAYAKFHNLEITTEVTDLCVELADRYLKNKHFPDKAFDVLDSAAAKAKLAGEPSIKKSDVTWQVAKLANIAPEIISEQENVRLAKLADTIKNKVFGQDTAIDELVDSIILSKSGLRESNKPIGSFLFTGPTGVGKTFVATQLAKQLGVDFHRFDMSEYAQSHTVAKLIGAPPGYVGYGEGKSGEGQLIQAIMDNPGAVILMDEVEKAHPDVLKVMLQVMEDGRLTSNKGNVVDFSNAVIIYTANLGAADAEKRVIGFGSTDNSSAVDAAIKEFFSPEFRNRLDAIVKFNKLTHGDMTNVVDAEITKTRDVVTAKGFELAFTTAAKEYLATTGYDPMMGARPLKRLFDQEVKRPMSKLILFGDLKQGDRIVVDVVDGKITVKPEVKVDTVAA